MRLSATLGGWSRRDTVLASFLAAALALAALSVPFHIGWLGPAGLIVAAVVGVARLVMSGARARLEGRREQAELDRRLRVPLAPVSHVDPTQIGVDPAAQDALPGATLPDYLDRDVDAELRAAIAAALAGRGKWLVVVEGPSKVGKSRTLFEALRSYAVAENIPLSLVAPVHGDALRSLLDPAHAIVAPPKYAVLWLDDLEPFLNQGVTLQTLREWRLDRSGWIVVATFGGKGSELIGGAAPEVTTLAAEVLQHAREIPLSTTTASELEPLREQFSAEFEAVGRHGLAAYLVAGPALQRKLTTATACTWGGSVPAGGRGGASGGRLGPVWTYRPD